MSGKGKGIIFIPDISGYSKFVKSVDAKVGAEVIADLLSTVIRANKLSFAISEVEGDAILFYRLGTYYPISVILDQFEFMLSAFRTRIEHIAKRHPQVKHLSLKSIVHYGELLSFNVAGFTKLYGNTVVEAHRLLKNSLSLNAYVIITESYRQADQVNEKRKFHGHQCELYEDIGDICFDYIPYDTYI